MSINSWLGFDRGANQEAADYALQNDGQISLNPLQRFFGADEKDVQNILDTRTQKANDQAYGAAAIEAGLTPYKGGSLSNYGESTQAFAARIKAAKTKKEQAEQARVRSNQQEDARIAQANAMEILGAKNTHSNNQFNATLKSQIEQNAFERGERANERSFNRKENDLNRRQERELADSNNSLQMQMAIMQSDLAEKRMDYDRETARMDKRDRMIAQLMSGLGSLGAAFG